MRANGVYPATSSSGSRSTKASRAGHWPSPLDAAELCAPEANLGNGIDASEASDAGAGAAGCATTLWVARSTLSATADALAVRALAAHLRVAAAPRAIIGGSASEGGGRRGRDHRRGREHRRGRGRTQAALTCAPWA